MYYIFTTCSEYTLSKTLFAKSDAPAYTGLDSCQDAFDYCLIKEFIPTLNDGLKQLDQRIAHCGADDDFFDYIPDLMDQILTLAAGTQSPVIFGEVQKNIISKVKAYIASGNEDYEDTWMGVASGDYQNYLNQFNQTQEIFKS